VRYYEEAREVWRRYVPRQGQSDTVQGELLRCVEKLRDEAERNGNGNYGAQHRRLVSFLRTMLTARDFPAEQAAQLRADLKLISRADYPVTDDDVWDRITERLMEWCLAHPDPVPKPHDPDLLI